MKTDNGQKTAFLELMQLMKVSIEASGAKGRAFGKVKDVKEKLAELVSVVPGRTKTEIVDPEDQMIVAMRDEVMVSAVKIEALRQELTVNEAKLAELGNEAAGKRKAFDTRLGAVIGDMKTDKGQEVAKSWGFFVQKSVVIGLIRPNAFLYVDPRKADSLRLSGETYVQGHNVLGKQVVHGVNPQSVQDLDTDLTKALTTAQTGVDPDKVVLLRTAQANLRKHCGHLLKMKVKKVDGMRKSAYVQHAQSKLGTGRVEQSKSRIENTSMPMGETLQPVTKGPKFTSARKQK